VANVSAKPFSHAIAAENKRGLVAVIPDIKCTSPKEGDLLCGRDPLAVSQQFIDCGAPLLSVVTESKQFGGSPELLAAVAKATGVPVLRKDFITTEAMVEETAELGAAAVLLICSLLNKEKLFSLYKKAIEIGIEPFVETHTLTEMKLAQELGATLVGINNRDITTLEKDEGTAATTATLASFAPSDALLVSESGIFTTEDAQVAAQAGANAVLVGTALWQTEDATSLYASLQVGQKTRVSR